VDAARSSSSAGTGLGLAIVKSIMELHGGSVQAESEPGVGTKVTLTFPVEIG
jgi:signal transduction histidine kinase